jgi:hypothetical protein
MSPDRIRQVLGKRPFEPFTVLTGDGSSVNVLSQEFAYLRPGGRTLLVSVPKVRGATEEYQFEEHQIDVFLITKVITPVKQQRRDGRRRAG